MNLKPQTLHPSLQTLTPYIPPLGTTGGRVPQRSDPHDARVR